MKLSIIIQLKLKKRKSLIYVQKKRQRTDPKQLWTVDPGSFHVFSCIVTGRTQASLDRPTRCDSLLQTQRAWGFGAPKEREDPPSLKMSPTRSQELLTTRASLGGAGASRTCSTRQKRGSQALHPAAGGGGGEGQATPGSGKWGRGHCGEGGAPCSFYSCKTHPQG